MVAVLPVVLAFATTVCGITALAALGTRRVRHTTAGKAFLAVAVAAGVWAGAVALQLTATSEAGMQSAGLLALVGALSLAVAWPAFVLAYTGHDRWTRPRRLGLLAALPTVVLAAVLVPSTQDLVFRNTRVVVVDSLSVVAADPGPLLYAFIGYTYALDVLVLGLLLLDATRSSGVRRRRSRLLAVAGGLPLAVSVTSFLDNVYFDLTPVAFAATSVIIAYAVLRYDVVSVVNRAEHRLVESTGDGYLVVEEGSVVAANDAARRILDIAGPDDAVTVDAVFGNHPDIRTAVDQHRRYTTDLVRTPAEGVEVYEVAVEAFRDSGVDGSVVILRDVTTDRLREKRAVALLDRVSTPVSILTADGRIRYANPAHRAVLGYAPAALEGTNVFTLVHPDDRERVEAVFRDAVDGATRSTVEARYRTASGEWVTLESDVDPLFHDPYVQGMVVSSRDVTMDRQARTRLRVVNRVLRHDLRNDTNAITGYVDLLAAGSSDPDAERYADIVRSRANRLLDIGEKARIVDDSVRNPTRTTVDVAALVTEVVESLREEHPDADVSLRADDACWATVTPLVDTAFENVMENAIVHNDNPVPTVDVEVAATDEDVVVTVADDGPPIPRTDRRALQRGRETQLEHASGLGLWVTNWLVQESGGTLTIDSDDPRGNVVTLRLLAAGGPPERGAPDTIAPPEDPTTDVASDGSRATRDDDTDSR